MAENSPNKSSGEKSPPAEEGGDLRLRLRYLWTHPAFRRAPLITLWRLLVWRVHCLLKKPAVIDLRQWGARFYLPPWWGGQGTTIIYATRDAYEAELADLGRFVSPGGIVVDAGANCGIYTVAAASLVGEQGRVIAFEPGGRCLSILRRNIELNGLTNVRVYEKALSDRDGRARLYHHRGPVSYSMGAGDSDPDRYDEVATITLDTMAANEGIDRVDFLKMDIEGAEEPALRGGETLLARSRPVIVFEMNPSAAEGFGLQADGAWRHLERRGYRFFVRSQGGLTPLSSPPEKGEWEFRNFIAIHTDHVQCYG
jgi:FkbM family methyltransferase